MLHYLKYSEQSLLIYNLQYVHIVILYTSCQRNTVIILKRKKVVENFNIFEMYSKM